MRNAGLDEDVIVDCFDFEERAVISSKGVRRLRSGHLWVYSSDITKEPENPGIPMVQVADADALYRQLLESGALVAEELADQPWGHRNFRVDDPDGFAIWFYQIIADAGVG